MGLIGAGVVMGIDLLDGPNNEDKGGVMILIADGRNSLPPYLDERSLLDKIKDQKIRIVTLALGSLADKSLENFAVITKGKTYFISDDDTAEGIINALEGALTFQPNVPMNEMEIVIKVEKFKKKSKIYTTFLIDKTIGKDVKVFLFVKGTDDSKLTRLKITFPDGSKHKKRVNSWITKMSFDTLAVGKYSVWATFNNRTVKVSAADIKVTSKSRNNQTLPIWTKCKVDGIDQVDPNDQRLMIIATVKQGGNPVLGATIE